MSDRDTWDAMAAAFGVLGRLHREPPEQQALDSIRSLADDWPLNDTDDSLAGIECLHRSAVAGERASAVRSDHDRLYGVSATARVAPYESVWRSAEKLVFDEETMQVRQSYRAAGLSAPDLHREPDDHVGLEFDFVAQLLLRALDAPSEEPSARCVPLQMARLFLDDHLNAWAPAMLTAAAAEARTEFMAGVALLSRGALVTATAELPPRS